MREVDEQERTKSPGGATKKLSYFSQHPKSKFVLFGGLLAVAAAVAFVWHYFSVRESTDDAQIDGHVHEISARVSGTITTVNVENDEYVEAGTIMAEIDDSQYRVAVQRAEADVAAARARLEASRVEVPVTSITSRSQLSEAQAAVSATLAGIAAAQKEKAAAEARVESARARVRQAEANCARAARDVDRLRPLVAKEEISQRQYDAAAAEAAALLAGLDIARATLNEAQQAVEVASSRVEQARDRLEQAKANARSASTAPQQIEAVQARSRSAAAQVKQAEATLADRRLNLQHTKIIAPVNGVVSRKTVEVGQTIQTGQPVLALVSLDDIWVTANFKETQLDDIRPGQPAAIAVDAYGGKEYRGHVASVAAATGARFSLLPPENATGNYVKVVQRVPVKIVFEKGQDPEHLLRPGMSVTPTVFVR